MLLFAAPISFEWFRAAYALMPLPFLLRPLVMKIVFDTWLCAGLTSIPTSATHQRGCPPLCLNLVLWVDSRGAFPRWLKTSLSPLSSRRSPKWRNRHIIAVTITWVVPVGSDDLYGRNLHVNIQNTSLR